MSRGSSAPYQYYWPTFDLKASRGWENHKDEYEPFIRDLSDKGVETDLDSRDSWPAFFPSAMCLVTTGQGDDTALEKVVGATIVNRFPYVMALSLCKEDLSGEHRSQMHFSKLLEKTGQAAIQFLPDGNLLDSALNAIEEIPENETHLRLNHTKLETKQAISSKALVFKQSYLVYETSLVKPSKDFNNEEIYSSPWMDIGNHRIFFLEINAIQLSVDIAEGRKQIYWKSLPLWDLQNKAQQTEPEKIGVQEKFESIKGYTKGYSPHYKFPSEETIAFEYDKIEDGMAIKHLPPLPEQQIEVDNDKARWPCFFPSSAGLITMWAAGGKASIMPCASTCIVSRHPFTIAICISYAAINVRYAPRATLEIIKKTGKFNCAVPYIDDQIITAIKYSGNISLKNDPEKFRNSGLEFSNAEFGPVITSAPITFECKVKQEIKLGTHTMFLANVERIRVHPHVTRENPIEWLPWPRIINPTD